MSRRGLTAAAAAALVAAGCAGGGGAQSGGSSTATAPPPPPAPPYTAVHATGLRKPWVTTAGTQFVDQKGNPVVLRGVNMSVGQAALAPAAASHGANNVRIHIGLDSIDPHPPLNGR